MLSGYVYRLPLLSHTKCFESRFARVNFPTNPSTYSLLVLVWRISWQICVGIDFCQTTLKIFCVRQALSDTNTSPNGSGILFSVIQSVHKSATKQSRNFSIQPDVNLLISFYFICIRSWNLVEEVSLWISSSTQSARCRPRSDRKRGLDWILSGNEVYYTNSSMLLVKKMLCGRLHRQKGLNLISFHISSCCSLANFNNASHQPSHNSYDN